MTPALVASAVTARLWHPVTTRGRTRYWTRPLPAGARLTITPAAGGQRWRWTHRAPAPGVPSAVLAEGTAQSPVAARCAADRYLTAADRHVTASTNKGS